MECFDFEMDPLCGNQRFLWSFFRFTVDRVSCSRAHSHLLLGGSSLAGNVP